MGHYDKQREEFREGLLPINKCREKIIALMEEVKWDTMQVFDHGATKHPDSGDTPNFLTPNGNKCSLEVRGKSALGHVAKSHTQPDALDDESGLEHILHAIASLSVIYIRHKRGIVHPDDIKTRPVRESRITNTSNLCAPSNWQYPGEATKRGDE